MGIIISKEKKKQPIKTDSDTEILVAKILGRHKSSLFD